MTRKAEDLLKDRRVRKALGYAATSLGSTPSGRKGLAAILAVLVAAVVWINVESAGVFSPGGDEAASSASQQSVDCGSRPVSEDAYRAAKRDAQRGSDVQRAHLDPSTFERVAVRHVVDGDTIAVEREDGQRVSVRLVGIDTPESVAPQEERNCEEGVLASKHMKSLVGAGDTLWLQFDTSGTDKYDRLLAYVWRELPASAADADDPAVVARGMLNAIQVIDGYGQPKTYRPDTYHDNLFAQWGEEAVAEVRGVTHKWA